MTTTGTTPGAPRSTTGILTTEGEVSAAELAATAGDLTASVADLAPGPMQGIGRPTGTSAGAAESPIVPVPRPTLSAAIIRPLEDTPNPAVRAAEAPARLAAMTMADKPGPIRRAAAPAWVAEERVVAEEEGALAVAGIGNQRFIKSQKEREI